MKMVALRNNHNHILKKYGFGIKYPAKIFVVTETGLNAKGTETTIGGEIMRRNWILKNALYQIEYDIKSVHGLYLGDKSEHTDGKGEFIWIN